MLNCQKNFPPHSHEEGYCYLESLACLNQWSRTKKSPRQFASGFAQGEVPTLDLGANLVPPTSFPTSAGKAICCIQWYRKCGIPRISYGGFLSPPQWTQVLGPRRGRMKENL